MAKVTKVKVVDEPTEQRPDATVALANYLRVHVFKVYQGAEIKDHEGVIEWVKKQTPK